MCLAFKGFKLTMGDELIFRWLEQFVDGITSFSQSEKGKNEFIETEIKDWLAWYYEDVGGDDAEFARQVIPRMQNILYGNTIKRIGRSH